MECGRCGQQSTSVHLDEESGEWLCGLCQAEEESCGCIDEPEEEE